MMAGFVFKDLKTNQPHQINISLRAYKSDYGDRILGDEVKQLAKKLRVPLKELRLEGYGMIAGKQKVRVVE